MKQEPISYLPTISFAARFGVKADTVRHNLCIHGNFMGIKPLKLPNGRLLWPDLHPTDILGQLRRA